MATPPECPESGPPEASGMGLLRLTVANLSQIPFLFS